MRAVVSIWLVFILFKLCLLRSTFLLVEETFDVVEEVGLCSPDLELLLLLVLLLLPPLLLTAWLDCSWCWWCAYVDGGGVQAFIRELRGEYSFEENGIGLGFGDCDGDTSSSPDIERFKNCFRLTLPGVETVMVVLLTPWLLLPLLLLLVALLLVLLACRR